MFASSDFVPIFAIPFGKQDNTWDTSDIKSIEKRGEWRDSLAQLVEHNTFNVGVSGSSPERITKKFFASLAQLVEHDTLNVGV